MPYAYSGLASLAGLFAGFVGIYQAYPALVRSSLLRTPLCIFYLFSRAIFTGAAYMFFIHLGWLYKFVPYLQGDMGEVWKALLFGLIFEGLLRTKFYIKTTKGSEILKGPIDLILKYQDMMIKEAMKQVDKRRNSFCLRREKSLEADARTFAVMCEAVTNKCRILHSKEERGHIETIVDRVYVEYCEEIAKDLLDNFDLDYRFKVYLLYSLHEHISEETMTILFSN